jgi:hypothetical protein
MLVRYLAADPEDAWTSNRVLLVVLAALLGFVSAYILEIVKSRRTPRRALSWDVNIEEPQLRSRALGADRLKVSYQGHEVARIVTIRYTITNTGTLAVKNQFIRFRIPSDAKLLEREVDPPPEPELGVEDLTETDPRFTGPRYRVRKLDPDQSVSIFLVADGGSWHPWRGAVLHNDEDEVIYRRRDVAQSRDEGASLAVFLFCLLALLVTTVYTGLISLAIWLAGRFYLYNFAYYGIALGVTLVLTGWVAYLLTNGLRAMRSFARKITSVGSQPAELYAAGKASWFAYAPGGSIQVHQPPQSDSEEVNP